MKKESEEWNRLNLTGQEMYAEIKSHLMTVDDLLCNQPSARDLEATDEWIRDVHSMAARHDHVAGLAKSFEAILIAYTIDNMTEEEYKRVKTSSTIFTAYVAGKWPKAAAVIEEAKHKGKTILAAMDDTRSLLSSFRSLAQMEESSKINQRRN